MCGTPVLTRRSPTDTSENKVTQEQGLMVLDPITQEGHDQ